MKLRKQGGLKAAIAALSLGLLVAFLGLVKTETPASDAAETGPATPAPNYDRFFAPGTTSTPSAPQVDGVQPHTRSRAS